MFRTSVLEVEINNLESLPKDFNIKLSDLEGKLSAEKLTHEELKELFDLYSVIIILFFTVNY